MKLPARFQSAGLFLRHNWQSIVFALCVAMLAIMLGMGFYLRGRSLMDAQLKARLRDTAAVAAQQFDAAMIANIRGKDSLKSNDVKTVVDKLRTIRSSVPGIRFAYIMRRTEDQNTLEFVADADSLAGPPDLDLNRSGTVDPNEEASYPGDLYDISDIPALKHDAFLLPTVDPAITQDQWGSLMSGYAPIRGVNGEAVAILGLDMNAAEYLSLAQSIFSPVAMLLLLITSLVFAGYVVLFVRNRRVDALQRIDQERSELLLLATHQLGTPLTIFQWSLESLRDSVTGKGGDPEKDVENMEAGCAKLRDILTRLRAAVQAEGGMFAYTPQLNGIGDAIAEAVRGAGPEAGHKQQRIETHVDAVPDFPIDKRMIAEVVRELLENASTFAPAGSVITVTAKRKGDTVQVDVRDDGCGILKTDLPRLFRKFVRGTNAHLSRPDGNGLGLFISKRIIERAGGTIWIESTEGKGTTVSFSLPIQEKKA